MGSPIVFSSATTLGSPMARQITAEDVAFSLTRALSPQTAAEAGAALAGPSYLGDIVGADEVIRGEASELSGLRVVDDRTVEIELEAPRATFLMKLASAPAAIVDPDDVARGGEWWRDPNASGPYVVDIWEPEVELQLYANEQYVGGVPDLRRVTFRLGPSAANPFNLYQADEIDVAGVPIQAIDRVSDEESPLLAELDVSPVLSTTYIAFRTDVAPMDDPEIRRAVQLAFPRWKVAEILLGGRQETANGLIPPGTLESRLATRGAGTGPRGGAGGDCQLLVRQRRERAADHDLRRQSVWLRGPARCPAARAWTDRRGARRALAAVQPGAVQENVPSLRADLGRRFPGPGNLSLEPVRLLLARQLLGVLQSDLRRAARPGGGDARRR